MVDILDDIFNKKKNLIKIRPIQMNVDLKQHCKLEIHDLHSKSFKNLDHLGYGQIFM